MLTKIKRSCAVEIKSNKLMSCLSLSTMSILTLASIVLITIINVTPIVILGLAELEGGQRDLILYPQQTYFNTTKMEQIAGVPVMPRFETPMLIFPDTRANGYFMNFQLEQDQHLGTIAGGEEPNHRVVYAHDSLGVSGGEQIKVAMLDKSFLSTLSMQIASGQIKTDNKEEIERQIQQLLHNSIVLKGTFTVGKTFDGAEGKFGMGAVDDNLYLDLKYAPAQIIQDTLNKTAQESPLLAFMTSTSFSMGEFATEATVNLPNRVEIYSNPDYEATYQYVSHYGEEFMTKIGLFSVESSMPIAQNLVPLGFVGMFIGVMLKLIIFSLFILSVIMMNNMLLMGVQEKNFDFALMKVMGADRVFIVVNLLTNSLKYVLLANIIAYPLAYLSLKGVSGVFEDFFGYEYNITPTGYSILGGIIIGVLVPVVSAILPIWDVIKNDLAQNLNPIRNKTESIKTEVYIEGRQFPLGKFLFGTLATAYGLMIYYLLPKSLINQNLGLLLIIFFIILQGLLVGLILLSYSFQYLFERFIAHITLFWADKTDFTITLKNLSAHRFKNRRSSILYALSVSFIIFVSVGLDIQVQTVYNEILKWHGSYVDISNKHNLDRFYYNQVLSKTEGVQDWAFITHQMGQYLKKKGVVQSIMVSDRAKLYFGKNRIYGVSPNLINSFFYERVSVYSTEASAPFDPYSYLYSPQGYMTCTFSLYLAKKFGIQEGSTKEFYINFYYENSVRRVPINYTSLFDKRIGLLYSSINSKTEVGVSFDTYRTLAGLSSDQEVPVQYIKIKVDPANAKEVAARIRRANMGIDKVWDYSELKTTITKIQNVLNNIQNILLVIVLIISFFSLVTTTYVNVLNQTNQIAILMVLGYAKSRIVRIYIYEGFVLVLNSCLIGVGVGYFVAWMMSLQREIFSDLPVEIKVPGVPLIILVAIISSLLATVKPLREIFSKSISQIMNYAK